MGFAALISPLRAVVRQRRLVSATSSGGNRPAHASFRQGWRSSTSKVRPPASG